MKEKQFYKITSAITQFIEYAVQQKGDNYGNKSQYPGSYDPFEYEKSGQRPVTGNAAAVNRS